MANQHHHQQRRSALITGAAGRLGQKLCDHLASQNKNIIGIYREHLPRSQKCLLPLCCDLKDTESIVAPLKTTDTVVHLAWRRKVGGVDDGGTNDRSVNAQYTQNLIEAMERAGTKRIIFLSWVGVDRQADLPVLREKYQAENLIINSNIPEKIILRAGLVFSDQHVPEVTKFAGFLPKLPLILPTPQFKDGIVVTTVEDILTYISNILKNPASNEAKCKVIDLTSIEPTKNTSLFEVLDQQIWKKKRWRIGGFVGHLAYRLLETKFGFLGSSFPKLSDFIAAATLPRRLPAEGVPPTIYGIESGSKMGLAEALKIVS